MQSAKILICEDDTLIALDLEDKLTRFGYTITGVAADETEAFRLAEADRPDLALMDIHLKGNLSGPEIAAQLRARHDVPAIYLSAHSDPDTISRASETEPLGYLVKPVRDSDLELSIRFGLAQDQAKKQLRNRMKRNREKLDHAHAVLNDMSSNLSREIRMNGLQDLIGGIAHFFNNSLMSVSGYLEFLEHAGGLQPYQVRQIQPVLKMYAEQKEFVQRLLWTSGHTSFNRTFVKIAELVDEAISALERNVSPKVKFIKKLHQCKHTCLVDRDAVSQAVTNIVKNSIEAISDSGTISIEINESYEEMPQRFNSQASPGKFCLITIRDSGSGIPESILPKIFEPFYSTRLERLAPGLGLSEAYGILQEHGGWIEITSEPNSGTTAQLFIPIGEQP